MWPQLFTGHLDLLLDCLDFAALERHSPELEQRKGDYFLLHAQILDAMGKLEQATDSLNRGFRAAEIRNRAILACRGDYCIFLDGDCIAASDFIATHRRLAESGWFVTGNRVLLSPGLTDAVLREKLRPQAWSAWRWIRHRLEGSVNRLAALLRLPLGPLRKLRPRQWRGARSCNLAVWRSDLERIDGFDACFTGWGREDSDLLIRLLRCGLRRKDGRFATGVIHLWHPPLDRAQLPANDARLDTVLQSDRTRAQRGLSALRTETLAESGAQPTQASE